jgi:hypothetical protein
VAGRQAERERSRRLFHNIAMQKLFSRPLCRRIGEMADRSGRDGRPRKNRPRYRIADGRLALLPSVHQTDPEARDSCLVVEHP